jgi:hypothetical protein
MTRTAPVCILAFLVAIPTLAYAAHGKAGLWNVSTTMQMAGMPAMPQIPPEALAQMRAAGMQMPAMGGGAQTMRSQLCMTAEQVNADKPPQVGPEDSGCAWTNMRVTATQMSADLVCKGKMNGTGKVQMTYARAEHYDGDYSFKGTMEGNPADFHATMSGDWAAASCGNVKPAAN